MQESDAEKQPWPSTRVAWFTLGVLVVAFIFSFIDRIIIALLVDPIKRDLEITDVGIGLLQGLYFAVFYTVVGLPIGRWADRYSRRLIIGSGIAIWSVATALCGLTRSFTQLFLARVGVGVGQAALSPAAYSMLADYFPKDKMGRAIGIYQSGAFFGIGIAFLIGGFVIRLVSDTESIAVPLIGSVSQWQLVFLVVGLPGLLVALLMFAVKEPVRRGKLPGHDDGIPLGKVLRYAGHNWRIFLLHFAGFSLLAVPITNIVTWAPAYFSRSLGYTPPEAALTLGTILLVLSPAGVYCGGWLADRLQQRGYADAPLRVGIGAALLLLPLSFLSTTVTNPNLALILFCPFIFCASLSIAVAPAALQLVAPNQMRAQISATWMLVMNLITATVGPTGLGFITVWVFADAQAVGYSMALVNCVCMPLAALALWRGLKPFRIAMAGQAANA